MIQFTLSGPAEWRGGIAQGPENYILSKNLPLENGVNRVPLRAGSTAGAIQLQAEPEGLKPATITLRSVPTPNDNGLSLAIPGDELPSDLDRGPTPSGPSFRQSRFPIQIVDATAGANASGAARSFDNNETTLSKNGDKLSTAWIEYHFAELAVVNEITLKLASWRSRRYALLMTLDGQEVFTGNTPNSLGYVALPLKHVSVIRLRIQLSRAVQEKDPVGNIMEITGEKDAVGTGVAPEEAKGTFGIVEAEIYKITQN